MTRSRFPTRQGRGGLTGGVHRPRSGLDLLIYRDLGSSRPVWRSELLVDPAVVEEHESQAEAAAREVQEETGLAEVRLLEPPAPALPAGFPPTHARVPLPWWITEMQVPADNHLAAGHVHVDHVWVSVAADPRSATRPAHPFAWLTADEVAVLPMFEDARLLASVLFTCISDLAAGSLSGPAVLAPFPAAAAG